MAARYIMISRYPAVEGHKDALCEKLAETSAGRILKAVDGPDVIELTALPDDITLTELSAMAPMAGGSDIADMLVADIRREILTYIEAPKGCEDPVPQTRYIQLRHVEVRPAMMAAYRKWREETIFDVVRGNAAAKVFLAYHTLIGGAPGVMFVAGFDAPLNVYNADFTSDRYREIVRKAGDSFITGGTDGLYTEFFEAVDFAGKAVTAA